MQKWPVSSKMPIIRSSLHNVTIFLAQQGIYRKRYLFIPNVHEEIIKSGSCHSNHYSFLSNAKRATDPAVKDSPARKMKRSTWSLFWHRICFSLPLTSCYYVKEVYEGPFSPSWKKGGFNNVMNVVFWSVISPPYHHQVYTSIFPCSDNRRQGKHLALETRAERSGKRTWSWEKITGLSRSGVLLGGVRNK